MWLDWQQLGIQPTLDQRAIKRAYAARLKQCRPDEQPEAFQRLHAAYKQALEWAAWQAHQLAEAAEHSDADDDRQQQPVPAASTDGTDCSQQETTPLPSAEILTLPLTASLTSSPSDELALPQLNSAEALTQEDEHLPASLVADATVFDDNQPQTPPVLDQPPAASADHAEALASPVPTTAAVEAEPPTTNPYAEEGNRLLALVDALLAAPKRAVIPANWHFLGTSPLLLDLNFNWQLGVRVCERIGTYNLAHEPPSRKSRRADMRLGTGVLRTLDLYFNWQHNRDHLERALGQEHCDAALRTLTEPRLTNTVSAEAIRGGKLLLNDEGSAARGEILWYNANAWKRAAAVIVDLALVAIPLQLIYWLAGLLGDGIQDLLPNAWLGILAVFAEDNSLPVATVLNLHFKAMLLAVAYLCLCWLCEAGKHAASPGKRLLGLRLYAEGMKKVGYIHAVVRTLMLIFTSLGSYLTLLVNLFMGKRFLHDLLSRTVVIDVNLSHKRHDPFRYRQEMRWKRRQAVHKTLATLLYLSPVWMLLAFVWFQIQLVTDAWHLGLNQSQTTAGIFGIGLTLWAIRHGIAKLLERLA